MPPDTFKAVRKVFLYAVSVLFGLILLYIVGGVPVGYYSGYYVAKYLGERVSGEAPRWVAVAYYPLWQYCRDNYDNAFFKAYLDAVVWAHEQGVDTFSQRFRAKPPG